MKKILLQGTTISLILFLAFFSYFCSRKPTYSLCSWNDVRVFTDTLSEKKVVLFDLNMVVDQYLKTGQKRSTHFKNIVIKSEEGGLILKEYKKKKYHKDIIGEKMLPLFMLNGSEFIDIEVVWKVGKVKEKFEKFTYQPRLLWCDGKGKPIRGFEKVRVDVFVNERGRWITDCMENIPVPKGVDTVRLDLQIPGVNDIYIKEMRVFGKRRDRFYYKEYNTKNNNLSNVSERGRLFDISMPQVAGKNGETMVVAQGAEFEVDNVRSVKVLTINHKWKDLVNGNTFTLGSFAPHVIQIDAGRNEQEIFYYWGSDAIEIKLDKQKLLIRAFVYHPEERYYCAIGVTDASSVRKHRNLGITQILKNSSLKVFHDLPGGGVLFPLWQPEGRLATIVFTEHADCQTVPTDEMVMFGNRENKLVSGVGFLGNNIPITKSVFAMGKKTGTTSLEQDEFLKLIRFYKENNYPVEVAIHTASPHEDDLGATRQGLERVSEFGTSVWIDHGSRGNLEDIRRLGSDDANPEYYLIPLLHEFGYRIVWSYHDFESKGLNNIFDNRPANLVFSLPALDDNPEDDWHLTLFSTKRIDFEPDSFSIEKIRQLIKERGVCIVHCYLSYNKSGYINMDKDSPYKDEYVSIKEGSPVCLDEWFNDGLRNIAKSRDEGNLYLGTLTEWINYIIKVRNVEINPKGDRFEIENNNSGIIKNMTFGFLKAGNTPKNFLLDGKNVSGIKEIDDTVYFYTDIPPGKHEISLFY